MATNILVVDDAAFMRTMISETLTKNGYNIIAAAENGEKAIAVFKADRPDLVILDKTLPDMDGIEVLKAMKELEPNVRVIIYAVPEYVNEAFAAGAKDFVDKPFTPVRLVEAVKRVLDDGPSIIPAARSSAKRVLIVDRSASIRSIIGKYVNDVCHCDAAEAKDGKMAVEIFRAYKPDAVFIEIQIPGMNGLAVCREMRKIDADVPVVVLTKQEYVKDGSVVDEAIKAGANDFIIKPFKADRFKQTVKAILE